MTTKTVDAYIATHSEWSEQLLKLREILLGCGFEESVKWGAPSYSVNGDLLIGLGAFKNHLAIWFHQGALLKDKEKVLVNAQEGKTRAMRQWRFDKDQRIPVTKVRAYANEVKRLQKAGKKVRPLKRDTTTELGTQLPDELNQLLKGSVKARRAFDALTPGKQREYAEHISSAKREETRARRLEKVKPMILAGQGLNDKYRDC